MSAKKREKEEQNEQSSDVGSAKMESNVEELARTLTKELGGAKVDNCSDFISTGSTILDYCIANRRNGGIPVGRISTFSGLSSTGKSLLAAHVIANTQKKGGVAAYLDTEHAANDAFMQRLGVDWKKLIYVQPKTVEDCFENIVSIMQKTRDKFPNKERPVTIIWDSMAATPPKAEIEGDFDPNSQMGIMAKALARGMRKITGDISVSYVTLLLINQLRDNMKMANPYSDPHIEPGGKAVPFHASVSVRLKSVGAIKIDNEAIGVNCRASVTKTRHGPGLRSAEFPILYEFGIDDDQSIYDLLCDKEVIKGTTWKTLSFNGAEIKLQSKQWKGLLETTPGLREWALDQVENVMVKKYAEDDDYEIENIPQKETKILVD